MIGRWKTPRVPRQPTSRLNSEFEKRLDRTILPRYPVRFPATLDGTLICGVTGAQPVTFFNLSSRGAAFIASNSVLIGSQIILDLPGLGPVDGEVRWALGGRVGVLFSLPIDVNRVHGFTADLSTPVPGIVDEQAADTETEETEIDSTLSVPEENHPPVENRLEPQHREAERIAASGHVMLRRSGARKVIVDLVDMSRSGARISVVHQLDAGELAWLAVPGLEPIQSRVAWMRDWEAGLTFVRQIDQTVLDFHLTRLRPAGF